MSRIMNKLRNNHGINRLVLILIILLLIAIAVAAKPVYNLIMANAEEKACVVALKKAQDMLDTAYLDNYTLSYEDAVAVVERSKWEMDALCPGGGDYFIIDEEARNQGYVVSCGLHEKDTKLRTRLNATHVKKLLEAAMEEIANRGQKVTEDSFTFTVNSKELVVERLAGDNGLRWGTSSSIDFSGVVAFFSLSSKGEMDWFVYADENHAAVWNAGSGWSGDAYGS